MADGADLTFDVDAFDHAGDAIVKRYVAATGRAVQGTTKQLERALEAATQAAVPGRLWRGWASRVYGNRGTDPAGIVYVRGGARSRGAMTFWSRPGEIRGKTGQFLAVPLPAAGPRGRDLDLSPSDWERAHGVQLRFVDRPGKAPLLVVDEAVLSGRKRVAKAAREYKRGRAETMTIPVFVLLPTVRFRNTLAIEPIVARAQAALIDAFLAAAG